MAVAGGFRLAFWSEQAEHHGPRLQRALARYRRFSDARPPGWPASPVAALARFLCGHVRRQDGPEHGMAYDVAAVQRADQADVGLRALPARTGAFRAGGQARRPPRPGTRARRAAQPAAALPPRRARAGGAAADRAAAAGLRAPGTPGRRPHAVRQRAARSCGSSSATSGSSPAGIPATPTVATGPPTATRSSGGCRCPPGGGRGRRREASAPRCLASAGGLRDVMRCMPGALTASRQPRRGGR